ncbi:hypothetical protein TrVE_jg9310 [Triparma verrucosa]|uniref:Uncharacterized protein n=1 Tax=Triparma verrucosa TaxID=1606542 RepID=A0A9W7CHG1_9STRA|nr:hypothetical protein TrVE_jg9310 [Triparma verrucosa]
MKMSGSSSGLHNPAEYLARRSKLLTSLRSLAPVSARFGSAETELESTSSYASRRRDLLTKKFNTYANHADTVLIKQQARAALRRAVKAENDLIRREELIVTNKLAEKDFEGELFVKLKSTIHLSSGITSMSLLSRSSDLCCVCTGKKIVLVNLHVGKVITTVEDAHNDSIIGAAFSSRNNILVTISLDKTARVWIVSDKLLSSISADKKKGKGKEKEKGKGKGKGKSGAGGGDDNLTLCSLIPFKGLPTIILFPPATSDIGSGSVDESVFCVIENAEGKSFLHAVEAMRGRVIKSIDVSKSLTGSSISSSIMSLKAKKVTVKSACFNLAGSKIYMSLSNAVLISTSFSIGVSQDEAGILGKVAKVKGNSMVKGILKGGIKTKDTVKKFIKKRNSFGGGKADGFEDDEEDDEVKLPSFSSIRYRTYDTKLRNPTIVGMSETSLNIGTLKNSNGLAGAGRGAGENIVLEDKVNPFLPMAERGVSCFALSEKVDNLIVAGNKSGAISFIDPHGGEEVVLCKVEGMHGGEVRCVGWSYDWGTVVSGDVEGDLCVWEVGREEEDGKGKEEEGLMRGWNNSKRYII